MVKDICFKRKLAFIAFVFTSSIMGITQSSASENCSSKVSVLFNDPGHRIVVVNNPNDKIFDRSSGKRALAFVRYRGLNFDIKDANTECGKQRQITVNWNQPVTIFMPDINRIGKCAYNLILAHEEEHAKIYRTVPKSFEAEIIEIASNSNNPKRALTDFHVVINQEMRRRNEEFHAFERVFKSTSCGGGNMATHRPKSEYTWASFLGRK